MSFASDVCLYETETKENRTKQKIVEPIHWVQAQAMPCHAGANNKNKKSNKPDSEREARKHGFVQP